MAKKKKKKIAKRKGIHVKKRDKMQLKYVPISELEAWDENPRINDDAAKRLVKVFEEHGFINPIIATPDKIIRAGHTRLKAAKQTDLKELPVLFVPFDSEVDAQMYSLADNKASEWAEWNSEMLTEIFEQIRKVDPEKIAASGFRQSEIPWQQVTGVNDDDVPAPPDKPTTRLGDIWVLGRHRLLCGNAGETKDVDRLLKGASIHLINTDPPYNVSAEPRSKNAMAAGTTSFTALAGDHQGAKPTHRKLRAKDRPIEGDSFSDDIYAKLLRDWFGQMSRVLDPGRAFYIWGGYINCATYPSAMKESAFYFSQAIIWVKMHPVMNRKDFMGNHEWCFYGWKEGAAHQWHGPMNARDVWDFSRVTDDEDGKTYAEIPEGMETPTDVWEVKKLHSSAMVHLTEKPVELATRAMTYSSQEGENVLDLFGGSGSTLIGAEKLDRNAFLMELDPLYCDVIVKRYEKYTGKKAVLRRPKAPKRKAAKRKVARRR